VLVPAIRVLGTAEGLICYAHFSQASQRFKHPTQIQTGTLQVPIHLFRRKDCDRSFAYSVDATGRNIPPVAEDAEWVYVGMVAPEQLEADPEALRCLRTDGFYLFKG
jgi:hypothetical protein